MILKQQQRNDFSASVVQAPGVSLYIQWFGYPKWRHQQADSGCHDDLPFLMVKGRYNGLNWRSNGVRMALISVDIATGFVADGDAKISSDRAIERGA
jgi:hypothetical protein